MSTLSTTQNPYTEEYAQSPPLILEGMIVAHHCFLTALHLKGYIRCSVSDHGKTVSKICISPMQNGMWHGGIVLYSESSKSIAKPINAEYQDHVSQDKLILKLAVICGIQNFQSLMGSDPHAWIHFPATEK